MVGYRCQRCGEFSMDPDMAPARIAQYDDAQREGFSAAISEIWSIHRVAPRLDTEGVDKLVGVATGTPELKALAEWFRDKRMNRG